jgi:hypothetical protein
MDDDKAPLGTLKHDLKNQLGIVLGFIELLIEETPEDDSRHVDMLEIRKATYASLALLDRLQD